MQQNPHSNNVLNAVGPFCCGALKLDMSLFWLWTSLQFILFQVMFFIVSQNAYFGFNLYLTCIVVLRMAEETEVSSSKAFAPALTLIIVLTIQFNEYNNWYCD